MLQYWLISLPDAEKNRNNWKHLNEKTSVENDYSVNYKLNIPELKIGTLDTLMSASESLHRLDQFCESLLQRMIQQLAVLLEKPFSELYEKLQVNGLSLEHYITLFQWDEAKYPIRCSIQELYDIVNDQMNQIDSELKSRAAAYTAIKSQMSSLEKKQTGNLLVRNLSDIIQKQDLILDSEYLQTLLVVVPK
jgi:V-type H+-transporting ATPase subunit C